MKGQHTLRLAALVFLAAISSSLATVRYVWQGSPSPGPPYDTWASAAHDIQTAVDAAVTGYEIVVTNGVYATGGRVVGTNLLVNRVAVDKPLALRSVNGPEFTSIQGYQVSGGYQGCGDGAIRCAYLTNGAILAGFTLTNGATRGYSSGEESGGGVWCESTNALVTNCIVTGNSAYTSGGGAFGAMLNNCTLTGNTTTGYGANTGGAGVFSSRLSNCTLTSNRANNYGRGGGASGSTLNNCMLIDNWADYGGGSYQGILNNCTIRTNWSSAYSMVSPGGGAYGGTLNNCTLVGNMAVIGGGASSATLNNCIVYFNTDYMGSANYDSGSGLNYCCTTPKPASGLGNITNAPLFVNYAGDNLRLQSGSPCINAGNSTYVTNRTDLDGRPRLIGTVDMGAYEFQGPFNAWLQQYGLSTDGSADFVDTDGDGHNNWEEWRCQTDPTNALSALRLVSASPLGSDVSVSWQSVAGVNYFLERSTNLSAIPSFASVATNVAAQAGTTIYTHTNAATAPRLFYRVGVGN